MLSKSNILLCLLLPWHLCQIAWASTLEQQIIGVLDELCPRINICGANGTLSTDPLLPGWKPCCTECSCTPTCSLTGNCCFSSAESREYHRDQTCTSTWTPVPPPEKRYQFSSYYMYTDPPKNGCISDAGNSVMETQLELWRNLLPVHSKKTNKLYLNQHVAECHGELYSTQWRTVATCRRRDGTTGNNFDMMANDVIFSNESDCQYQFQFPGNKDNIESERCFPELISSCGDEPFQVPTEINMSPDDVRLACESNFFSPYTTTANYANVFCYLCNANRFGSYAICSELDGTKSDGNDITILLNPGLLREMQSTPKKKNEVDRKLACPYSTSLPNECRVIMCPKGQIRAQNGTCVWLYGAMLNDLFGLFLKLVPTAPIQVAKLKPSELLEFPTWLTSPWPAKWLTKYIYYEYTDDTHSEIKHIWVDQTIQWKNKRIDTLVKRIKATMNIRWTALVGKETIALDQTIDVNKSFRRDSYYFTGSGRKVLNANLHHLFLSMVRTPSRVYITNPFFCDLVELYDGEFTTTHVEEAITYVRTNRTLSAAEYALHQNDDGQYKVMICFEHSDFVLYGSGCSGKKDLFKSAVISISVTLLFTYIA